MISIILIGIIATFTIPNLKKSSQLSNITTLKSQLSLIQNAITKKKSDLVLLGENSNEFQLDEAVANKEGEKLFSNVLDFSILSTNSSKKEIGKWIKIDDENYKFFLGSSKSILFSFENQNFKCISDYDICKELN
jgi:type II secretory pathway pseudopilin PulG